MIRSTGFAPFAIIVALTAAPQMPRAQAPTDAAGYLPLQTGNVVGGGGATIIGSSDDAVITRTWTGGGGGGGMRYEQPGRIATFLGNDGSKPLFGYGVAANTNPSRVARLVGSGDDARVIYAPMR